MIVILNIIWLKKFKFLFHKNIYFVQCVILFKTLFQIINKTDKKKVWVFLGNERRGV